MKTKTYHHGDLKNALISASIKIIEDEGLQNLSIRYAAKKVGVSHTAPYRHFKKREDLLVAIAIKGFEILDEMIGQAISSCAKEHEDRMLEDAGRAYIDFAKNNSNYYRIMYGNYINDKTGKPELFKAMDTPFRNLVKIANKYQQVDEKELQFIVFSAWSLLHGYSSLIIDNIEDESVRSEIFITGILKNFKSLFLP